MSALAVTDDLFFNRADATLDRAAAAAHHRRTHWPGPMTASCSWNTARARASASTTAAYAPPITTPRWASACAPCSARRPATPMPASCRTQPCAAPPSTVGAVRAGRTGSAQRGPERHQRAALFGRLADYPGWFRRPRRRAVRDRRVRARPRSARGAGDGVTARRVAGRADHARRRRPHGRPAPAGAAERQRRGGAQRQA